MKVAGHTCQKRFIDEFDEFVRAVVKQAQDRDHLVFREHLPFSASVIFLPTAVQGDAKSYMAVRRDTVGAKPSFALLEMDMELPQEVFDHPTLATLRDIATDMLYLANVCSPSQNCSQSHFSRTYTRSTSSNPRVTITT